ADPDDLVGGATADGQVRAEHRLVPLLAYRHAGRVHRVGRHDRALEEAPRRRGQVLLEDRAGPPGRRTAVELDPAAGQGDRDDRGEGEVRPGQVEGELDAVRDRGGDALAVVAGVGAVQLVVGQPEPGVGGDPAGHRQGQVVDPVRAVAGRGEDGGVPEGEVL